MSISPRLCTDLHLLQLYLYTAAVTLRTRLRRNPLSSAKQADISLLDIINYQTTAVVNNRSLIRD
jgi:hypothetical protein